MPGAIGAGVIFARASAASFPTANGRMAEAAADTARFSGGAQRLLLEGMRTNLLSAARSVGGTGWALTRLTAAPSIGTGPDGAVGSAITLTETEDVGAHYTAHAATFTIVADSTYAFTAFVRPGTCTNVQIVGTSNNFGTGGFANFVLTGAGSLGSSGAAVVRASITALASGWYVLEAVMTASTSGAGVNPFILALGSSGTNARLPSYAGTAKTVDVAWAQLERASFASTIILPPAGSPSQATRAADTLSAAASGFFPNAAGTLLLSVLLPQQAASDDQVLAQIDNGSDNSRVRLRNPAGGATLVADVVSGGSTTASLTLGSITAGTAFRIALAWDGTGIAGVLSGGAAQSVSSTLPTGLTTLRLGNGAASTSGLFGTVIAARCLAVRAPTAGLAGLAGSLQLS
ncbi:hypothetical protein IAI18_10645 [Acetobacteraceae bacterium H6797]|nr:hypothetical protein [Acetobacteraceae bacterium H6797]